MYKLINDPTDTPHRRRFDVDITSIRQRPNFDKFPRHFYVFFRCSFTEQKLHIVSTYVFWRNFDGQKIHVVSTYFFECNFAGRNIHVFSTYIFQCNFDGQKFRVASTHFFQCTFSGRKNHVVFTYFFRCNLTVEKTSSLKKLTFARFFSLKFSGKSPSNITKRTKQLLYHLISGRLHSYEVTLAKKCNKPLLQKTETNIFDQKRFIKNLFTLIKLSIATKFSSCLHCYIIF